MLSDKIMKSLPFFIVGLLVLVSSCAGPGSEKNTSQPDFKKLGFEPVSFLDTIIENSDYVFCLVNKTGNNTSKDKFYTSPEIIYYKLKREENDWKVEQ